MEVRPEYDPYRLPLVRISIQSQAGGSVDAGSSRREKIDFVSLDVAKWNDATPVLYDLIIEVIDYGNRVICVKKKRFGFKTSDVLAGKFHINDVPARLKCVRYTEFDPKGGISVPLPRLRQDIMLMKRCGINTVIGTGFPLSDTFMNLCDQYGVYVIACCDRRFMRDYAESALNHPSVIMWGINDYGFDAQKCERVKDEIKSEVDPSRPWYCGEDDECRISDLQPFPSESGVVYGPWVDLCLDRKEIFRKYGNKGNIFETIRGRSRFDDDTSEYKWIHHADLVGGKNRADSSIGQGIVDSERNPHPVYSDIRSQCQDISIFANPQDASTLTLRNSHPFAYTPELVLEWKIMLGGMRVTGGRGNIPEIEPYGTRTLKFPINIDKYLEDGWAEGNPALVEMYMELLSHQIVFDVSLKLSRDTYYAKEGFEISFYQDIISEECGLPGGKNTGKTSGNIAADGNNPLIASGNNPQLFDGSLSVLDEVPVLSLEETALEEFSFASGNDDFLEETSVTGISPDSVIAFPDYLEYTGNSARIRFSRINGALCGISAGGNDFVKGAVMPSFYRCPSNIDRTDRSFILSKTIFSNETDYEEIQKSVEFSGMNYGIVNGNFSIVSRYRSFAMKGEILVSYEIPLSGIVRVSLNFTPKYDMIRYGFRVPVIRDDILCSWYGRGPGESYYDRKNASKIGVFQAGADRIFHSYARPAENSSHTDTQAVRLEAPDRSCIEIRRVSGSPFFDFTILPFTPEQMNDSLHDELLMKNDFCELMIDFCSKEIERTDANTTNLPLKKNVTYNETFEIRIKSV